MEGNMWIVSRRNNHIDTQVDNRERLHLPCHIDIKGQTKKMSCFQSPDLVYHGREQVFYSTIAVKCQAHAHLLHMHTSEVDVRQTKMAINKSYISS